ncbi:MAG: arginine--tRNA ligase [Phycisphaerae bacterium]|jgi:arginyl-tRNA synthetase
MNVKAELERRISAALESAGAAPGSPALVATSARAELGDYQANGVMAAAKALKTKPRELADKVVAAADLSTLAGKLEVAGPGFINVRLAPAWLAQQTTSLLADEHLGVNQPANPQTIVIDYSHPNLAKEMHVGHLRSTIIGDALARVLEFCGLNVIRQNHVGDWGTQFGMLLAYMERLAASGQEYSGELSDLEEFYVKAKRLFDADPAFADVARKYVFELQSGIGSLHDRLIELWRQYVGTSLGHCQQVYDRLNVSLTAKDLRGESAFNDDLPKVVEELKAKGLLTESQGAQCVFLPEFKAKDGEPLPVIVQKSDEGYLYATTDLAAMRYRVGTLHANRLLYVVDARQTLHLRQVFAVGKIAGFLPDNVSVEHAGFGVMLGKDGKPFKTRAGGTVKLMDLLEEAVKRAYDLVSAKSPELSEEQRREIARIVGIGAVKYADLSQNRTSDYVFSWEKMLSLEGNTAPYMQYAYARIKSIFRKAGVNEADLSGPIVVTEAAERALAVKLVQFPETIAAVAADCTPNVLCAYLYDLAGAFMGFYENCPVLQSEEPTRSARLMLCKLTARTIKTGLGLLGIDTAEQM